ncbi:High-affinity zinc uptake system binding-protein ZnuA [Mycolicibacterium vanbaalenii]|uniref:High-affinity zinc uptake system binding-protein ZnuA n=1 Tax=Mycolicibacterium vanbaalenii TaxID=110539 RepID=A0A5S9MVH2_MYCVN|nr:zinc ABC transporter substrate-binding protein [Mycolicibacterium vanbaalenii]CAA0080893.1 High-affinity zinc uptake system binding-protein ZnuA [Mycolicibacterium vanbaalenii]
MRVFAASLILATPFALSACGSNDETAAPSGTSPAADGECPATPVDVVVSVDQWGDIVSQLGGACANVTTVLASSSVDPHDYEPAPSDAALFDGAQLVVINGGHYDEWAAKLAAASAPDAPIVNAVESSGGHADEAGHDHDGGEADHDQDQDHDHDHADEAGHDHAGEGNPHVWYSPSVVTSVAEAVTGELSELAPDAAGYFDERHTAFENVMTPYYDTIAAIKADSVGKSFAATESVFDDMGAALGLQNRTPEGYQLASSNEAEPAPADLDAFLRLLGDRGVDVLIYNTQTEGSVPEQIRAAAEQAGVPVVEVTETVPPNTESFQTWQVAQLDSLAEALGVPV